MRHGVSRVAQLQFSEAEVHSCRRTAGSHLQGTAKGIRRFLVLSCLVRTAPENHESPFAAYESLQAVNDRIADVDAASAPLLEMQPSLVQPAEPAVCHGERVVNRRSLW